MKISAIQNRGVALITALLILVIASTAAAYLMQQLNLSMRRSGNIINSNQAYLYALGAETLAIIGLNEDTKLNKIDSYEDIWAMEFDPFPVEDGAGYISVQVSDLQSRFNINNLIKNGGLDTLSKERFERLLTLFNIDPEVSNAVIDWIDADINTLGIYGAEDDYYLGLEPPYRTANRPLSSISELRQVRGLDTAERFNELAQYLVALPEHTAINVNLASYEIHYAITGDAQKAALAVRHSPAMLEQANAAESGQQTTIQPPASNTADNYNTVPRPVVQPSAQSILPYADITDYFNKNDLQPNISKEDLSVESQFFLVSGESELDRGRARIKSVLQRLKGGKIRVWFRTLGDL
jgi:general secretion pathway protein K